MNANQKPPKAATFFGKSKEWILKHKAATALIVIVILAILGFFFSQLSLKSPTPIKRQASDSSEMQMQAPASSPEAESGAPKQQNTEIEVTEGDIKIKSEKAKDDEEKIRSLTQDYEGYVEQSRQNETETRLTVSLTTRIPTDQFEVFLKEIKDAFNIDSYNVRNYRIDIERAVDEREILKNSMTEYSQIRDEIEQMNASKEKINLLMEVTESELELASKERRFEREISQAQKRGDLSTLSITIEQKLPAQFLPENIGTQFRNDFSEAIEKIVDNLTSIVTEGIVIFFAVIKLIIFAFLAILPLWFVVWLYKKYRQR